MAPPCQSEQQKRGKAALRFFPAPLPIRIFAFNRAVESIDPKQVCINLWLQVANFVLKVSQGNKLSRFWLRHAETTRSVADVFCCVLGKPNSYRLFYYCNARFASPLLAPNRGKKKKREVRRIE